MEFVKVKYPRARRVLLDGEDFEDTNKTFEVERGTHTFAVDEPTVEQKLVDFIELTSQQSPRVLSFTPALDRGLELARTGVAAAAKPSAPARRALPGPKRTTARKKAAKKAKPGRSTKAKAKVRPARRSSPAKKGARKR